MALKKNRNMKVHGTSGYRYKATPTIMLKGEWLKELGFEIGDYVSVCCENGKLVITQDAEMAAMKEAEAAIMAIEDEREQAVSRNRDSLSWMETFKKYRNITSVNRSMVVDLIRQVNVFEGGRVEVVFRHADEAEKVVRMLEDYSRQAV